MSPRKAKNNAAATDLIEVTPTEDSRVVEIKLRDRTEWMELLVEAGSSHWRTLKVVIRMRAKLLAGKPKSLNFAEAMVKARGLEEKLIVQEIEDPNEVADAVKIASEAGLCEFHRREGKPGIWFPCNNIKAGLKENWSVLGFGIKTKGSKGALAEGMFVYSDNKGHAGDLEDLDWIYLGVDPQGIEEGVVHSNGPAGPRSSLKRNEFVLKKEITFYINFAKEVLNKVGDRGLAKTLVHFQHHGLGASRSQGYGKFDVVSVEDTDNLLESELQLRMTDEERELLEAEGDEA